MTEAAARAADRRTVRRALKAGGITFAVLAGLTLVLNAVSRGDVFAAAIWVASSLVVGLLVTAGWLVLAAILDMVAGDTPSPWRLAWTGVAFVVAFLAPILPAALLQVASER